MKQFNRNKNNQMVNYVKMFLFTTLAALLAAGVLLLLSAVLLEKLGLTGEQAQLLIFVIYIISGLTAGLIAGKWQRERKFMWGALAGLVWLVVVFVISLFVNGTAFDAKELFPAFACMVGGGMIGGMLA